MNSYWLSRANTKAVEGPFPFERLEALYRSCQINGNDDLCHVDAKEWTTVEKVMARHGVHVGPTPAEALMQMQRQESKKTDAIKNSAAVMLGLCVLFSAVPLLGLLVWFVYGVVALACLVLAIVLMTRDAAGSGVLLLLLTFIGTPVAMFLANVFSLAVMGGISR